MTVYFVEYCLIIAIALFIRRVKGDYETKKTVTIVILFFIIFIILAFRHQSMGIDLGYKNPFGYLASFERIAKYTWEQVFSLYSFLNYEKGYIILNKLISIISTERQFLLIVCAFLSLLPIALIIRKYSNDILFSIIIYMGLPSYLILFSGLRQGIAIAICFFSIRFIDKKKVIKFIICIILATLFHYSAIVFIIAYPVYWLSIGKKFRILSIPVIFIVFALRYPLFSILSSIFKENVESDANGAVTLFLIFVGIYFFCTFFYTSDVKTNGYLNLLYIACICLCFSGVYSTALRVGYYFIIVLTLLLPDVIMKIEDEKIFTISKIIVFNCFLLFGMYSLATTGWTCTNPYYWFWQIV